MTLATRVQIGELREQSKTFARCAAMQKAFLRHSTHPFRNHARPTRDKNRRQLNVLRTARG